MKIIAYKEKGVSLIITFFIMIIVLSIVLSISIILYSEIKIIRNMSDSVVGFCAADSGVEKVLFYDNQIIPSDAERGLCSMCLNTNELRCPKGHNNPLGCNDYNIAVNNDCTTNPINGDVTGCQPDICNNCEVRFSTDFNHKTYYVTADVDSVNKNFIIKSKGVFGSASRQVEIVVGESERIPQATIQIENACVIPVSQQAGTDITISANVSTPIPGNEILTVKADIYHYEGAVPVKVVDRSGLVFTKTGANLWTATWPTSVEGAYHVDLEVNDKLGNNKELLDIPPYPMCLN